MSLGCLVSAVKCVGGPKGLMLDTHVFYSRTIGDLVHSVKSSVAFVAKKFMMSTVYPGLRTTIDSESPSHLRDQIQAHHFDPFD